MALAVRESLATHAVVTSLRLSEAPVTRPPSETQLLKRRAAAEWLALPAETQRDWTEFTNLFRRYSPVKSKVIAPTPRSLYIKAALERWRLDPGLSAPTAPPSQTFRGDDLGVFAVQGTKNAPVPAGHLRFACTGRNSSGVMTVLLIQKLSGPRKHMTPQLLRAVSFTTFTNGALEIDLPVANGHYATAYRFVDAATLQLSPILEAGIVSVGIKTPRKKRSEKLPDSQNAPVTHAVIDTNRFTSLHHFANV